MIQLITVTNNLMQEANKLQFTNMPYDKAHILNIIYNGLHVQVYVSHSNKVFHFLY